MMHPVGASGESTGVRPPISLIVVNARIWTGTAARPWADALAVSGELLAAVGSSAEIRKLAGSEARVIDAARGLLVPGADGESLLRSLAAISVGAPEAHSTVLARGNPADFTLLDRDFKGASQVHSEAAEPVLVVAGGVVLRDSSSAQR